MASRSKSRAGHDQPCPRASSSCACVPLRRFDRATWRGSVPTARRTARRWPPAKESRLFIRPSLLRNRPSIHSNRTRCAVGRDRLHRGAAGGRGIPGKPPIGESGKGRHRPPLGGRIAIGSDGDRAAASRRAPAPQARSHGERGPWRLSCGGLTRTQPCQNIFDAFGRPFYPRGATKESRMGISPPRKAAEQAGFQTVGESRQIRPGRLEPHAAQEPIGLVDMPQIIH